MSPGNVFVEDDHGDVVIVWAPFEGRPTRIALTTEAAWDVAARICMKAAELEKL